MSEILTINTVDQSFKEQSLSLLPVFGDSYYMLKQKMPEYDITLPNTSMSNLVKRLKMTMKAYNGLSLSANQCGVQARVFVIGYGDETFACINPKVIMASDTKIKNKEGCISFPGMFLNVERPQRIEVEFITENGEIKKMTLEGITARCFLHELDHMNGIIFIEHVGPLAVNLAKQKQMKMIKKFKRTQKKMKGM